VSLRKFIIISKWWWWWWWELTRHCKTFGEDDGGPAEKVRYDDETKAHCQNPILPLLIGPKRGRGALDNPQHSPVCVGDKTKGEGIEEDKEEKGILPAGVIRIVDLEGETESVASVVLRSKVGLDFLPEWDAGEPQREEPEDPNNSDGNRTE